MSDRERYFCLGNVLFLFSLLSPLLPRMIRGIIFLPTYALRFTFTRAFPRLAYPASLGSVSPAFLSPPLISCFFSYQSLLDIDPTNQTTLSNNTDQALSTTSSQTSTTTSKMHGSDCPKCGASGQSDKTCSSCGAVCGPIFITPLLPHLQTYPSDLGTRS